MPAVERHIRIAAPIEATWDVIADVPGQPRWMHDLRDIRIQTPGPIRPGTIAIGTVRMFGLSQEDPVEITVIQPPTRYAIRHLGTFSGWGELRLTAIDDGARTHVRWREELRPDPEALPLVGAMAALPVVGGSVRRATALAARLADPLFLPIFTAVFRADLRRLRRLIETGRV
ncbi:MAG: SRPBCC family protein [Chloroflexota bacterium]